MSVLKDLLHGITPAERKRIEAEKEQEHQKWLQETRKNKIAEEKRAQEKIYNSPLANMIVNDLVDLFSQEEWIDKYALPCDSRFSAKNALRDNSTVIHISQTCIYVRTNNYKRERCSGQTTFVYEFHFQKNGYQDLTVSEKKYFIHLIADKLGSILRDRYEFHYRATKGDPEEGSLVYSTPDEPKCEWICIKKKDIIAATTSPQPPLKSW